MCVYIFVVYMLRCIIVPVACQCAYVDAKESVRVCVRFIRVTVYFTCASTRAHMCMGATVRQSVNLYVFSCTLLMYMYAYVPKRQCARARACVCVCVCVCCLLYTSDAADER